MDSYGASAVVKLGEHGDALAWLVGQTGKWGTLTHAAAAFSFELGYQFTEVMTKPWIRVGYDYFSGDPNAKDRYHNTFYAPEPTVRSFAPFSFYNMSNLHDVVTELILTPGPNTTVRFDYDILSLADKADLWYSSGGAFQASGNFGLSGRPSFGSSALANVIGCNVEYHFSPMHSLLLYAGHALGGSTVAKNFPYQSHATNVYLEYDLKFSQPLGKR